MSRTDVAGSERTCCPIPHSYWTPYRTDAHHSPVDGHRTQPSIQPATQTPSCSTSTARGGSMRRTSSDTTTTVGDPR